MASSYQEGYNAGREAGYNQGLEEGYRDGFQAEHASGEQYLKERDDEVDKLYEAFGNVFRTIIVRNHGKKNAEPKMLQTYLEYYVPEIHEEIDVEYLFECLK